MKAYFRSNRITVSTPFTIKTSVKNPDRAPKPEELTGMIEVADLREKLVLSMLALGGFREGTLSRLQYRHIKDDYETNRTPIHIHIEAEITKGKDHEYDTFIGQEAAHYLREYIEMRRRGHRNIPPEQIDDSSPLIRNEKMKKAEPISENAIYRIVHKLYLATGLITKKTEAGRKGQVRYSLRPHSIRKYFRTQLGVLNTVPIDYVEYMMGHTVSTYNDIKSNIDKLRELYTTSGLSITPRTKQSKISQLKTLIEALGLDPNVVLSREALTSPNRTVLDTEQGQIELLNRTLRDAVVNELQASVKNV